MPFSGQSPTCLDAQWFSCQGLTSQLTTNSGTTRLNLQDQDITAEECQARCPQGHCSLRPVCSQLTISRTFTATSRIKVFVA